MQYNLYKPEDNAEGQLDADIGASTLSIPLKTGEGALFPAIYRSTTTSGGTSVTLNKTGIGASGIAIGDFIENITDGSHAYVLSVDTNSLTTTSLQGGSDNTWQNGDTYAVNRFIITLNKRNSSGAITQSEKVLIDSRSGDILTANSLGRGFDGSTAQEFKADDYVDIFVVGLHISELSKALTEVQSMIDLRYTKSEVDALLSARNWKDPVKVATTVAGTLASSFENGDTVDGVVLATGNRILIKDQASAIENGIYVVNASGAPTRASDFDTTLEVTSAVVAVEQGTSNGDTVWLCTSDAPVVGTNNINFSQVGAALIKASQAEAEAATNDTKYMTPLKTIQEIVEWGDVYLGKLGDNFSSGDLSGNTNLAYLNPADEKWYKVTSTVQTWFYDLCLIVEVGNINDTVKIMRKGIYSMSFSNINPTFSSSLTGTDNNVGDTTARALRAFKVDNTNGAECVVTGGTISAKQVGTPAGAMQIYLMLEQQEQTNTPAGYRDATNNVGRGAIIASATIAQGLFSGSYQSLSYSFGASIKIPAGCKVYEVIGKTGAADASNYFVVQSNSATLSYSTASPGWSGTANAGNLTLTVTSTSPVGYSVKAYTGTDGSYGLTPSNPWSPVVGTVLSTTEMFFNPTPKRSKRSPAQATFSETSSFIHTITTNFCPSEVLVNVSCLLNATPKVYALHMGNIRGDTSYATSFNPSSASGGVDSRDTVDFLTGGGTNTPGSPSSNTNEAKICLAKGGTSRQNELYIVRLENGFYLYNGYPTGGNFASGGSSGYTHTDAGFALEAIA